MNKGSKSVVCARVGGANTTSFLAAHFAKRNTKFGGDGKKLESESEGEATTLKNAEIVNWRRGWDVVGTIINKYLLNKL